LILHFRRHRSADGCTGVSSRNVVTAYNVRRLEADVPKNERAEIAGAGHMMNIEQPKRFNAAVLDFLARLKGR
jgi:pimeloyl-ACP methyl ester carboxylesterase